MEELKSGGSYSSIYVTEEEEDRQMEIEERELRSGKRKMISTRYRVEDSTGMETDEEPAKIKRREEMNREQEELERMRQMYRRKEEAEEKRKKIEAEKIKEMEKVSIQKKNKEKEKEEKEDLCEDRVTKIQRELRRLVKATEKETGGKISFTKSDQVTVREAVIKIQNEVLEIMKGQMKMERKMMEMEKNNGKIERNERKMREGMKGKVKRGIVSREESSDSEGWKNQQVRRRRETYAEVSKMNRMNGEKIEGRTVVVGEEGWRTPPLRRRGGEKAIIVADKDEKDARKLGEELARKINVKEIGGAPKAVRKIRDGKIVIVSKDSDQEGKIKDKLKGIKNLEVRDRKKVEPLLIISGVAKGISEEELVGKIRRGMSEGMVEGTEEVKIIRRIPCRNPWKENVIFRVGLEKFKVLVKKGKIEMDCMMYYIEEYLGIAMCYKCLRFGHVMKHCSEAEACHKCAGGHDGRECKKEGRKCINCFRMFGEIRNHSAKDTACPAMQNILARSRSNIKYGN